MPAKGEILHRFIELWPRSEEIWNQTQDMSDSYRLKLPAVLGHRAASSVPWGRTAVPRWALARGGRIPHFYDLMLTLSLYRRIPHFYDLMLTFRICGTVQRVWDC